MTKDFIPYEQALDLKELGFDEPCFGYFDPLLGDYTIMNSDCINPKPTLFNHNSSSIVVSAPTFSQAFRFFREKYDLHGNFWLDGNDYAWNIVNKKEKILAGGDNNGEYKYEEAELECLKKLIEIVKKKNE